MFSPHSIVYDWGRCHLPDPLVDGAVLRGAGQHPTAICYRYSELPEDLKELLITKEQSPRMGLAMRSRRGLGIPGRKAEFFRFPHAFLRGALRLTKRGAGVRGVGSPDCEECRAVRLTDPVRGWQGAGGSATVQSWQPQRALDLEDPFLGWTLGERSPAASSVS